MNHKSPVFPSGEHHAQRFCDVPRACGRKKSFGVKRVPLFSLTAPLMEEPIKRKKKDLSLPKKAGSMIVGRPTPTGDKDDSFEIKTKRKDRSATLAISTPKRFATWGKKSKPSAISEEERKKIGKGGSLRIGKEAKSMIGKGGWLRMRNRAGTKGDSSTGSPGPEEGGSDTETLQNSDDTPPEKLEWRHRSDEGLPNDDGVILTRKVDAATKKRWRATVGSLALKPDQTHQVVSDLKKDPSGSPDPKRGNTRLGGISRLGKTGMIAARRATDSTTEEGSLKKGLSVSANNSNNNSANNSPTKASRKSTRGGGDDGEDEHSWGYGDEDEDDSCLSELDTDRKGVPIINLNGLGMGDTEEKKKKKKKVKARDKLESTHPSAEDILRKYYPDMVISQETAKELADTTLPDDVEGADEQAALGEVPSGVVMDRENGDEKGGKPDEGGECPANKEEVDGGSNPHTAKLHRYISEGIDFIATNLTTWAVLVSVPSASMKSEVAGITRYVQGMFEVKLYIT